MSEDKKKFLNMILNFLIMFVIVWCVFTFFLGIKMAPNDDMTPRISAGDILVYYRLDKDPSAQDVMVLKKNGTDYVARVIAVPGDEVEITKQENLIVNGNTKVETNIYGTTPYYEGYVEYPVKLGSDEYFVLADKREGGEDSRYFGPVKKSELQGTVIGQFRRGGI